MSYTLCLIWSFLLAAACGRTRPRDYEQRDYYAVEVSSPEQLSAALLSMDAELEHPFGELDNHYLVSVPKGTASGLKKRSSAIRLAERQVPRQRHKRSEIPVFDKSLFPQGSSESTEVEDLKSYIAKVQETLSINDPMFSEQWHLYNTRDRGHDMNITGVWQQGITGKNTVVALVDDGIDMNSRDIAPNYYAAGSYDFNDHNPVPSPKLSDDKHGTRCAGEIAAVRNDVCGIGVAYEGKVSGLRILSGRITDVDEAIALNYDFHNNLIYSCSWGPPDDGKSMEGPSVLIRRAIVNGILNGRNGKGSIFVFASGNGAVYDDNCNFDGYTNSIFSITIGGIDRLDFHPYYSELCASQLAVTYSSGAGDYIHTTDVGEDSCSARHGGTSAAAPLGAAVFALVLSIRPDLGWRDMQYLCAETAVPFNLEDDDWQDTVHGRRFNHKFGFGKIDAFAMVEKAKLWKNVKSQAWYHSIIAGVDEELGTEPHQQITSYLDIDEETLDTANLARVEHVTVTVNIEHHRRGDVTIDLISPNGIISNLATARRHDASSEGFEEWTLMTVKHWGESGVGQWRLVVGDHDHPEATGIFKNWRMTLWGECRDESKAVPLSMPGDPTSDDGSTGDDQAPTVTKPVDVTTGAPPVRPDLTAIPSSGMPPPRPVLTKIKPPGEGTHLSVPTTIIQPLPEEETVLSSKFDWRSKQALWLYSAIAAIMIFMSGIGVWILLQRRRSQKVNRDDYEFKELRNGSHGSSNVNSAESNNAAANDLYDAFRVSEDLTDSDRDSVDELQPLTK